MIEKICLIPEKDMDQLFENKNKFAEIVNQLQKYFSSNSENQRIKELISILVRVGKRDWESLKVNRFETSSTEIFFIVFENDMVLKSETETMIKKIATWLIENNKFESKIEKLIQELNRISFGNTKNIWVELQNY